MAYLRLTLELIVFAGLLLTSFRMLDHDEYDWALVQLFMATLIGMVIVLSILEIVS